MNTQCIVYNETERDFGSISVEKDEVKIVSPTQSDLIIPMNSIKDVDAYFNKPTNEYLIHIKKTDDTSLNIGFLKKETCMEVGRALKEYTAFNGVDANEDIVAELKAKLAEAERVITEKEEIINELLKIIHTYNMTDKRSAPSPQKLTNGDHTNIGHVDGLADKFNEMKDTLALLGSLKDQLSHLEKEKASLMQAS